MITVNKMIGIGFTDDWIFNIYVCECRRRNVIYHNMNVATGSQADKRLSVFFISDIHRRKIDDKLLAKVQSAHEIDIVIIGGDLAERGVPLTRIAENVRKLAQLGPLFYVWGNNDREVGEEEIREIITRYGGKILDNESVAIPGHPRLGHMLERTIRQAEMSISVRHSVLLISMKMLFLSHIRLPFSGKWSSIYRPRLMLAGHTHGGQIRFGKYGLQDKGTFRLREGEGEANQQWIRHIYAAAEAWCGA